MGENNHTLSEREEAMARFETCKSERGGEGELGLSAKKYRKNARKKARTC